MADVLTLDSTETTLTSVEARVTASFREAFSVPESEPVEGMKYREDPRWDSVGHMILIAALETYFDTMLEVTEILAMADYPKAIEIMTHHAKD